MGTPGCRLAGILARDPDSAYHVFALPLPERTLIARIRRQARLGLSRPLRFPKSGKTHAVVAGIGDDCAALRVPKDHEMLVTTDLSLEGVHFRREWHPPESVGHRCLARGLSDIAAMGGVPVAVFLSLALPANLSQRWVDGFLSGLLRLAGQFDAELAGGDTAQSPGGILADIVVVGSVPQGKAILRSTARPGDRIYVSGALVDLAHICEESGAGAQIREDLVPKAKIGRAARPVDLRFALHGGEDYQLLFTAPKGRAVPPVIGRIAIREVGVITRDKDILLVHPNQLRSKLSPLGWEHFRKHSPDK